VRSFHPETRGPQARAASTIALPFGSPTEGSGRVNANFRHGFVTGTGR
jgi:hypothetical protein